MTPTARLCDDPDCIREAHSGGKYCAAHAKRLERGGRVGGKVRERLGLRERVLQLCIDLADADSEDEADYERRWDALKHALRAFGRHLDAQIGGHARAVALSPVRRREIAKLGATARWLLAGKHLPRRSQGKRRTGGA
jgi:hypothetical protein